MLTAQLLQHLSEFQKHIHFLVTFIEFPLFETNKQIPKTQNKTPVNTNTAEAVQL